MLRTFGPALYREVMGWPRRLIMRAAEIAAERDAEARLMALDDLSLASGLKLGQTYIDPGAAPRKAGDAYTTNAPLLAHRAALERRARPWLHPPETPEVTAARLDAEQDAAYDRLFGGLMA